MLRRNLLATTPFLLGVPVAMAGESSSREALSTVSGASVRGTGDADRINLADFLSAEELKNVRSGLGTLDCSSSIQRALDACASLNRPAVLFFPRGRYGIANSIKMNPALDCKNLVEGVVLLGQKGHRSYDTQGSLPATLVAIGEIDCLLDLRASWKWALIGMSLVGGEKTPRVIRIGAEGTKNSRQIPRVGTIDGCQIYAGKCGVDAYLTSGFRMLGSNVSRATGNGIRLNACGDWELVDNLINTCGGFIKGFSEAGYYEGAALVAYGGGGNNNLMGGKIEVNDKGLIFDNTQGINISGVQFDKNKYFAMAIGGNQSTSGKTKNLGYQPRSFSITNCRFLASGWSGDHQTHVLINNYGQDLDASVALTGNSFALGGSDAYDLNLTTSSIYGVGPAKALKINNADKGAGVVRIVSCGNLYAGGASLYSIEINGGRVFVDSAADSFDKPCIAYSTDSYIFGTTRKIIKNLDGGSREIFSKGKTEIEFLAVATSVGNIQVRTSTFPQGLHVSASSDGHTIKLILENPSEEKILLGRNLQMTVEYEVNAWDLLSKK